MYTYFFPNCAYLHACMSIIKCKLATCVGLCAAVYMNANKKIACVCVCASCSAY